MQHSAFWHISMFGVSFFSGRYYFIIQVHLLNIVHLSENLLAGLLLAHFLFGAFIEMALALAGASQEIIS